MADKAERNSLNVPGPWYVDSSCVACGMRATDAPDNFKLSDDGPAGFATQAPCQPLNPASPTLRTFPLEIIAGG